MGKFVRQVLVTFLLLCFLGGCQVTNMEEENKAPVEYEVMVVEDMPESVQNLVEEKKEHEFQMTYQDDKDLYLIRGYGKQSMGGYSIQVEELTRGEEAITVKTMLIGPAKDEQQSLEPSYPCIVLRIAYVDMPVLFE